MLTGKVVVGVVVSFLKVVKVDREVCVDGDVEEQVSSGLCQYDQLLQRGVALVTKSCSTEQTQTEVPSQA